MVASAAGEASSEAISGALGAVAEALGRSPTVEDVQPLPASDSRGMVPFFLVLGVTVSAFLFQQLSRSQARTFHLGSAVISMVVFAALDGLLAALAVGIVVGFDSSYWSLAGVCALLALAVAAATVAFFRLFGQAGVGLAGVIVVLLANASSGSVIGPHFLPQPFRWLSPVLPAGAGLEAARSALYFEGAGLGWPHAALALWVLGALVVLACLELRRTWARPRADAPA
jgi:ABC-type multidrug transport system permease subunit